MTSWKRHPVNPSRFVDTTVVLHGYMTYRCNKCGTTVPIGLEDGVEGGSRVPRVATPFIIPCKCGGEATDRGMHSFDISTKADKGMEYFAYPADPHNQCAILSVKGVGPIKRMVTREDVFAGKL